MRNAVEGVPADRRVLRKVFAVKVALPRILCCAVRPLHWPEIASSWRCQTKHFDADFLVLRQGRRLTDNAEAS